MRCTRCGCSTIIDWYGILDDEIGIPGWYCEHCPKTIRSDQVDLFLKRVQPNIDYYRHKLSSGALTIEKLYHILLAEDYTDIKEPKTYAVHLRE